MESYDCATVSNDPCNITASTTVGLQLYAVKQDRASSTIVNTSQCFNCCSRYPQTPSPSDLLSIRYSYQDRSMSQFINPKILFQTWKNISKLKFIMLYRHLLNCKILKYFLIYLIFLSRTFVVSGEIGSSRAHGEHGFLEQPTPEYERVCSSAGGCTQQQTNGDQYLYDDTVTEYDDYDFYEAGDKEWYHEQYNDYEGEEIAMPMRRTLWLHPDDTNDQFLEEYSDNDYSEYSAPQLVLDDDESISKADGDEPMPANDETNVPPVDKFVRVATSPNSDSGAPQDDSKPDATGSPQTDESPYFLDDGTQQECCNTTKPGKRIKLSYSSSIVANGEFYYSH